MRTRGELICLTIEAGTIPCSVLYFSWMVRRREVSSMARRMESVTASA